MPAWWSATPIRRPRNTDWLSDDSPMAGESARACAIDSSTSRRCSRVISGRLLPSTSSIARSHPARLKMK